MGEYSHTFALIANGVIDDYAAVLPLIKSYGCVIAVDGGLRHCQAMGLTPDLIIGDMDSAPPELLEIYSQVPKRMFPRDKNETDLELAIMATFTPEIEKMTIFGALGHRTDHHLVNLQLTRRYPHKVFIETESELIFAFDREVKLQTKPGQTISFIPLGGPVSGVNSQGLKWELYEAAFDKYFMSLSNICLGEEVVISIKQGDLLCVIQK